MNGKTGWLKYWWQALLDLVYSAPPGCTLCRRPVFIGEDNRITGVLCDDCRSGICFQPGDLASCPRCSRYYKPDRRPKLSLCRECAADPLPFVGAYSVGPYTGVLRQAVHQFKYRGKVKLAQPLGHLLARGVEPLVREAVENDGLLVAPVPLHQRRLASRGFNQAQLLAEVVAVELNRRLPEGLYPVQYCPDYWRGRWRHRRRLV